MDKIGYVLVLALFTILLTSTFVYGQNVLTQQDNEAKQKIITNASSAVDHKWSQYDLIIGSKKFDNGTFVIYNSSADTPEPPPVCKDNEHLHEGVCVPNPPEPNDNQSQPNDNQSNPNDNQSNPNPEPSSTTKIDFAGDFSGTSVINAMKGDYNIALGDMGYKATLDQFISDFSKTKNHACVIGNHDAPEDGNAAIYQQARQYCGELWFKVVANGTTLLIGWNSNGNADTQLGAAQDYVMDSAKMDGIKNVVIMSHKPSQTHPSSHHNPESSVVTFYKSLEAKIPAGIKTYEVVGHNHEISMNKDKTSFLAGGGGQTSHRACSTNSEWTFCKTVNAYLQFVIDNNSGNIDAKFYNTSGGAIS